MNSSSDLSDKFGACTVESTLTDPFVKTAGLGYRCICCDISLNSLEQAMSHIAGLKHKKLRFTPKMPMVFKSNSMLPVTNIKSSMNSNDPYIEIRESGYFCILCSVYLNSPQQANNHIAGQMHQKLVSRSPIKIAVSTSVTHVPKIPINNEPFPENVYFNEFKLKGIEIKNVMANVKIFDVDNPIIFS